MAKPYIPPPRGPVDFPAMFWDPKTKQPKVYQKAHEVPDGHLNAHPDDENAVAWVKKVVEPEMVLKREEIIKELNNGGVTFRATEGTPALYKLLVKSLQKALNENGIKYPADADAKQLLELVPSPA